MNKILFLFILPLVGLGQDFKQEFNAQFRQGEFNATAVEKILENWKVAKNNDVEYYIAAFNFYFKQSQEELIQLTSTAPKTDQEALVISDSLDNQAGFMYSQINRNDSLFALSQSIIEEGILLFPDRLDLRFGKIHTLGKMEQYDEFTEVILATIAHSKKIKHQWLWSENEIIEAAENFFIDAIQDYQNTLFQIESDDNLKKITHEMYALFPNNLFVISSYGVTFLIEGKNKEALALYLKAEKINPNDTIVLSNLGLIYERLDDPKKAVAYYKKILQIGDDKAKIFAQNKINQLK